MKTKVFRKVFLAVLATILCVGNSIAQTQPLGFDELLKSLTESKLDSATANRIARKSVAERGLIFDISEQQKVLLREAGADNELLLAIIESTCSKYAEIAGKCLDTDFDCRVRNFDRALSFHPDDQYVLNSRGLALYNLRRFDEAIRDYTSPR